MIKRVIKFVGYDGTVSLFNTMMLLCPFCDILKIIYSLVHNLLFFIVCTYFILIDLLLFIDW